MNYIKIFIIVLLTIYVTGCAVFMPYQEDFVCNIPEGMGYCGSLSDGYEYSVNKGR